MATNRAAQQRRGVGQPSPIIPPAPAPFKLQQRITVEEWEAKAPLGELELQSIAAIKAANEIAPLPLKFVTDDSRPGTPHQRGGRNPLPGSRPGTPSLFSSNTPRIGNAHPLHPKQPVQTPQQFYDWFALIERSVAHSQEAHFRTHVSNVDEHLRACDTLLERLDEVDRELGSMLEGWRVVEEGGKSLQDACERLLNERDGLLELSDEIGSRLQYFQELEQATRMLNHPGESLVLQTDFLYMVERVDICIEYLKAHRQFRETEIYLFRFQQCMTRAMTLIKMYFVGSLRALSLDVAKRLSERDVSQTAQMHLLYTRFRSVTSQLSPLLGELERRAAAHPEELSALLAECHVAYFAARRSLLVGRLSEEIRGLDPTRTELVELTRAGCSYLKQLCTDEFNLYRAFFSSGEDLLYQYLENLCDYLYDDLRPRILHEPRLTALCEVCTVLQALMVLDVSASVGSASDSEHDSDDEDEGGMGVQKPEELTTDLRQPKKGLRQLHISHLLQMVLQDAQTRLFFRAQAVIQSDIRYYMPKPEDLAYPDILSSARIPNTGLTETRMIQEKPSVNETITSTLASSLDKQETWYPTLQKTVWVLSQLHDFVKPAIFEDIAQEAISLCRQSLVTASEAIAKIRNSQLHAALFLARHLLLLKDIAHQLDLKQRDSSDRNGDYGGSGGGGVTNVLSSMLGRTTSLLPDALFASLGMPRLDESIKEVKHGVDHDLRKACEDVISQCANPICDPIIAWVDQARAASRNTAPGGGGLNESRGATKPTAPPSSSASSSFPASSSRGKQELNFHSIDEAFRTAIAEDLRTSVSTLRLYLEEDRTVRVLVGHVQDRILGAYAAFREVVGAENAAGESTQEEELLSTTKLKIMLEESCAGGDKGTAGDDGSG